MKELALTQGKFALVDDEDFERLSEYNWRCDKDRARCGNFEMAHIVLQTDHTIDHKDGNTLDNRKLNLRKCSHSQNHGNSKKTTSKTSSKYKGVTFHKRTERWRAIIGLTNFLGQYIRISLGCFVIEEDAAKAYDEAARKHFGEFACLNFPKEGERSCINGTL